jgi:tripartite-type tricarboxylate transporter receptor subunit TctC
MKFPIHGVARTLCLLVMAMLFPLAASAQADWPQKPVKVVVPYAPGGSADTLGRLIARHLSEAFKQPFIIENRAGAGGIIGSQLVSKAPPDGYTLVVSGIGSHVIAPVESPSAFDPIKDFSHIALLGGPPLVMVVNAELPVKDVKGFIAYVNANPKGVSWGSPGQGTHGHLIGEMFRTATKTHLVHISYKGASPAVQDLLGGQIPAAFMTLSSANAHIHSGKLRALALSSRQRLAAYPDVPTFIELGYPALTGTTWFSLSGPPGMPPELVDRLNAEVRRGLTTPAAKALFALESMETIDYDAPAFTRYFKSEIEHWTGPAKALSLDKSTK